MPVPNAARLAAFGTRIPTVALLFFGDAIELGMTAKSSFLFRPKFQLIPTRVRVEFDEEISPAC
jgi:hypothetical protein